MQYYISSIFPYLWKHVPQPFDKAGAESGATSVADERVSEAISPQSHKSGNDRSCGVRKENVTVEF